MQLLLIGENSIFLPGQPSESWALFSSAFSCHVELLLYYITALSWFADLRCVFACSVVSDVPRQMCCKTGINTPLGKTVTQFVG